MNTGALDHRLAPGRSSGLSDDTHGDASPLVRTAWWTAGHFSIDIALHLLVLAAGMPAKGKIIRLKLGVEEPAAMGLFFWSIPVK
jgi:hypothetical protein